MATVQERLSTLLRHLDAAAPKIEAGEKGWLFGRLRDLAAIVAELHQPAVRPDAVVVDNKTAVTIAVILEKLNGQLEYEDSVRIIDHALRRARADALREARDVVLNWCKRDDGITSDGIHIERKLRQLADREASRE